MKIKVRVLPRVPNPANKAISPFLSPKVLFLARLLMFIYAAVVVINHVLQYRHDDHAFWPYLTILSYYCLTFYLFVSTIFTGYHAFKDEIAMKNWPKLNIMWTGLYHAITIIHLIVPIIYWALVYNPKNDGVTPVRFWLNISMHGFDGVFAIIELFISNHQFDYAYLLGVCLVLIVYLCYALIIFAVDGFAVYSFINYKANPTKFGVSVALVVVAFVVLSGVSWGLHKLRYFLVDRFSKKDIDKITNKYEVSQV